MNEEKAIVILLNALEIVNLGEERIAITVDSFQKRVPVLLVWLCRLIGSSILDFHVKFYPKEAMLLSSFAISTAFLS